MRNSSSPSLPSQFDLMEFNRCRSGRDAASEAEQAVYDAERRDVRERQAARATALLPDAVRRGDVDAVAALHDRGANLRQRLADGRTLQELAREHGRHVLLDWLNRSLDPALPGAYVSAVRPLVFARYYGAPFRRDLERLLSYHPQPHLHDFEDVCIQPRMLARDSWPIRTWHRDRLTHFATALFFTVLVDQVAWSDYHRDYTEFRRLTLYPKLRGDCLGGCRTHLHPADIFMAVARTTQGRFGGPAMECPGVFASATPVMRNEVMEFFATRMPGIAGEDFWRRCEREIPAWAR